MQVVAAGLVVAHQGILVCVNEREKSNKLFIGIDVEEFPNFFITEIDVIKDGQVLPAYITTVVQGVPSPVEAVYLGCDLISLKSFLRLLLVYHISDVFTE